ncbi:MAG: DUF1653 domain-containing protein [Chloroflexi bacterium]|nr:DUF1653 domain-containing protein [Chloroflexota bacterium]
MSDKTKPGIYRHWKGGFYRVLFTALDSTNAHERRSLVVYVSLNRDYGSINVRDEEEFHEMTDVGAGLRAPRFVHVQP